MKLSYDPVCWLVGLVKISSFTSNAPIGAIVPLCGAQDVTITSAPIGTFEVPASIGNLIMTERPTFGTLISL